jgi:hypothetical protein
VKFAFPVPRRIAPILKPPPPCSTISNSLTYLHIFSSVSASLTTVYLENIDHYEIFIRLTAAAARKTSWAGKFTGFQPKTARNGSGKRPPFYSLVGDPVPSGVAASSGKQAMARRQGHGSGSSRCSSSCSGGEVYCSTRCPPYPCRSNDIDMACSFRCRSRPCYSSSGDRVPCSSRCSPGSSLSCDKVPCSSRCPPSRSSDVVA